MREASSCEATIAAPIGRSWRAGRKRSRRDRSPSCRAIPPCSRSEATTGCVCLATAERPSRTGMEAEGLLQVESLAFDPADARILYAGTWRQAFRTRDGGATWSRIAEGMVLDATIYTWDFAGSDPRDIWD